MPLRSPSESDGLEDEDADGADGYGDAGAPPRKTQLRDGLPTGQGIARVAPRLFRCMAVLAQMLRLGLLVLALAL